MKKLKVWREWTFVYTQRNSISWVSQPHDYDWVAEIVRVYKGLLTLINVYSNVILSSKTLWKAEKKCHEFERPVYYPGWNNHGNSNKRTAMVLTIVTMLIAMTITTAITITIMVMMLITITILVTITITMTITVMTITLFPETTIRLYSNNLMRLEFVIGFSLAMSVFLRVLRCNRNYNQENMRRTCSLAITDEEQPSWYTAVKIRYYYYYYYYYYYDCYVYY